MVENWSYERAGQDKPSKTVFQDPNQVYQPEVTGSATKQIDITPPSFGWNKSPETAIIPTSEKDILPEKTQSIEEFYEQRKQELEAEYKTREQEIEMKYASKQPQPQILTPVDPFTQSFLLLLDAYSGQAKWTHYFLAERPAQERQLQSDFQRKSAEYLRNKPLYDIQKQVDKLDLQHQKDIKVSQIEREKEDKLKEPERQTKEYIQKLQTAKSRLEEVLISRQKRYEELIKKKPEEGKNPELMAELERMKKQIEDIDEELLNMVGWNLAEPESVFRSRMILGRKDFGDIYAEWKRTGDSIEMLQKMLLQETGKREKGNK